MKNTPDSPLMIHVKLVSFLTFNMFLSARKGEGGEFKFNCKINMYLHKYFQEVNFLRIFEFSHPFIILFFILGTLGSVLQLNVFCCLLRIKLCIGESSA